MFRDIFANSRLVEAGISFSLSVCMFVCAEDNSSLEGIGNKIVQPVGNVGMLERFRIVNFQAELLPYDLIYNHVTPYFGNFRGHWVTWYYDKSNIGFNDRLNMIMAPFFLYKHSVERKSKVQYLSYLCGFLIHIIRYLVLLINSLRPGDDIWCHWTWSTLDHVIACSLKAPSHYLNQCWRSSVRSRGFHLRVIA